MATAKQIAADRANLIKARTISSQSPRTAKQIAASLANLRKANGHGGSATATKRGHAVLGTRRVTGSLHAEPVHHKPTGINHRFKKRIAPTSFDVRGSWKNSRAHHFKKRLYIRKKKTLRLPKWRQRRGRLTPR